MHSIQIIICAFLFASLHCSYAQDSIATDSATTPFRKGRWLTGITGSISSSTNELKSTDEQGSSNEYSINILGGNFIEDRWLIGGVIEMNRSDAEGLANLTTEGLFIGPLFTRYLSDAERGSLYFAMAPGYSRYRNVLIFTDDLGINEEQSEGSGFGLILNLGYSYVVLDRIAFDIGVSLGQRWLNIDRTIQPGDIIFSDDITLRNLSFSFGFRVLLDQFLQ